MILKVMLLHICKDADYVWLAILESSPPEPSNTSSKDITLRCTQQGHSKTMNQLLLLFPLSLHQHLPSCQGLEADQKENNFQGTVTFCFCSAIRVAMVVCLF